MKRNSAEEILKRIDERLKALGLTDNAVGAAVGSRDLLRTIRRNVESGSQQGISTKTLERLAPVLKIAPVWLMTGTDASTIPEGLEGLIEEDHIESGQVAESTDAPPSRQVRVVGYVGAGQRTHYYAVAQGDLDTVPAPENATNQTVAVEIKGTSLGELFDRWLVFYDDVRAPVTADQIGKLCIVGLADDQILVKKIQRGRNGRYTLISSEDPIEDAEIIWAAKVTHMEPR